MSVRNIKFSAEDARVLDGVRRIHELGANGAKLILTAPIFDLLLAMGKPVEFAVNLANTDWEGIASGARSIQKIAACSAHEMVAIHVVAGSPLPTGPALEYFAYLSDKLLNRCLQ